MGLIEDYFSDILTGACTISCAFIVVRLFFLIWYNVENSKDVMALIQKSDLVRWYSFVLGICIATSLAMMGMYHQDLNENERLESYDVYDQAKGVFPQKYILNILSRATPDTFDVQEIFDNLKFEENNVRRSYKFLVDRTGSVEREHELLKREEGLKDLMLSKLGSYFESTPAQGQLRQLKFEDLFVLSCLTEVAKWHGQTPSGLIISFNIYNYWGGDDATKPSNRGQDFVVPREENLVSNESKEKFLSDFIEAIAHEETGDAQTTDIYEFISKADELIKKGDHEEVIVFAITDFLHEENQHAFIQLQAACDHLNNANYNEEVNWKINCIQMPHKNSPETKVERKQIVERTRASLALADNRVWVSMFELQAYLTNFDAYISQLNRLPYYHEPLVFNSPGQSMKNLHFPSCQMQFPSEGESDVMLQLEFDCATSVQCEFKAKGAESDVESEIFLDQIPKKVPEEKKWASMSVVGNCQESESVLMHISWSESPYSIQLPILFSHRHSKYFPHLLIMALILAMTLLMFILLVPKYLRIHELKDNSVIETLHKKERSWRGLILWWIVLTLLMIWPIAMANLIPLVLYLIPIALVMLFASQYLKKVDYKVVAGVTDSDTGAVKPSASIGSDDPVVPDRIQSQTP
jgi:hypothetical protein